jgi:uncharacterized phage infection (PIP) family protein YhgE
MDIQTIDNQYNQLQSQAQQTVGELRDLAGKLQAAAAAGDQNAREWLLDLKSIAIAIQSEQNQVSGLLQAIHNFADNQRQQMPQQLPQQPGWGQAPAYPQQPQYPQQQPYYGGGYGQPQGGFLGELLNSGFGRAIVTGAGFGIGDDLINKIF